MAGGSGMLPNGVTVLWTDEETTSGGTGGGSGILSGEGATELWVATSLVTGLDLRLSLTTDLRFEPLLSEIFEVASWPTWSTTVLTDRATAIPSMSL